MADYIQAPTQAVKEKFSLAGKGSSPREVQPIAPPQVGKVAETAIPPPLSMQQVSSFYEPLRQEIESLPPPEHAPVPAATPPLNAFLAVLGATLGASLNRNPAGAQQVSDYLIQKEQERKAIEAQNYARDLAFNENKRNQLIQVRGQALETSLQAAIQANDTERAAAIAKNLEVLRGQVATQMTEPAKTAGELTVEKERGRQARLTLADNIRMQLEKTAEMQNKPMTAQQFAAAIDAVNKNKELTTEEEGLLGPWWRKIFGGKRPLDKREAIKGVQVTALLAGEPNVRSAAKRRLVTSVLSDLGLDKRYKANEPFTPEDEAKFRKAFADLGLNYDTDVAPVP
jgi:hypothetical protein